MKKFITFVVSFAVAYSATASPTWNTVSVRGLLDSVDSEFSKHAKYLKSNKKLSNKRMKFKSVDDQTLIVSIDGQKVRVERVGEKTIEFNGKPVVFDSKDSPKKLMKKISKALNNQNQISLFESLFIPQAHAAALFTASILAGLFAIGLAIFGGYKWGEHNAKKKYRTSSAAVPAAQYQTPAAQTQQSQVAAPANPKAGAPYVPAVPGSVAN